jgi:membrane protease YdiL (CAAX protease family)
MVDDGGMQNVPTLNDEVVPTVPGLMVGGAGDGRDPGSGRAAWIATAALIVLALTTFVLQQMGAAAASAARRPTGGQTGASASRIAPASKSDPEGMSAEFLVRLGHAVNELSQASGGGAPSGSSPTDMLLQNLDAGPLASPEHRLRLAIAAAEVGGAQEGIDRAESLRVDLEGGGWSAMSEEDRGTLVGDAKALEVIYAEAKGGGFDAAVVLPEGFEKRHGYFARLVKTWGQPEASAAREALLGNGLSILLILVAFGVVIVGVLVGGIAMGIVAVVMLASGRIRWRFVPPVPGGSVFVETAAVFFLGFLGMKVAVSLIAGAAGMDESATTRLSLVTQWLLVPIIAWPVVRGMPWGAWRRAVGLHSGEGVFKEVLCGVAGYFAGVPLMLAAFLVSFLALVLKGVMAGGGKDEPVQAPENPIVDVVMQGGVTPWMLFALASFWAPLVEEVVFRGALYRHLRGSWRGVGGVVVSAGVTALVFGIAHGYEWMLLGPVIVLGFNFALMREWRGSLIAPIFAHFMHNATVLVLVIGLFSMLRE